MPNIVKLSQKNVLIVGYELGKIIGIEMTVEVIYELEFDNNFICNQWYFMFFVPCTTFVCCGISRSLP